MRVSDNAVRMIARFEGGMGADGRFHPYRDAVGVWTIGFGHTAGVSASSAPLSLAQAQALLRKDLDTHYAPPVNDLRLKLTQNQFDALVSAVYNLGPGILSPSSSLGQTLRTHQWGRVPAVLMLYDHAGGRVLPGLEARRKAEGALFASKTVNHKVAVWQHELAVLRATAKKRGWSKAMRIRGRLLKQLIARDS